MKLRKILMGLAAVVGFTTAASAATTPIVTVDGDNVTIQNTTGNAGGYNWVATPVTGKLCIPSAADLEAGSYVKIKSFQFWSQGNSGNRQYAQRVTVQVNGLAYTTDAYAGETSGGSAMTYSFPADTEPVVAVGETNSVVFVLANGKDGLRFRAGENGCGSDGFFQVNGNTSYAPQLILTAEKTADEPKAAYTSVLSMNFGESGYNVATDTDPMAVIADSNWYNINGNSVTDAQAGDAFVSISAPGTYRNGNKAARYLQSYLDDNTSGTPVSITVTNLTGVAYDVYIYCSSDNADGWPCKTVNDVNYYALANGEATLGAETWGDNSLGCSVLGSNVMVIRGVKPGDDGSITIASARIGSTKKRGCIAAIQLGEVEQVIPKEFSLDLSEPADWSSADWDPPIPEEGMAPDATATVTATGTPTLTLDGTITCGTLKIVSDEGNMLTLKKELDANTSIGSLDVSEATDGTTWDATEGFTACHALTTAARDGDYKFYFLGEGDKGATLDYGTAAYDNTTIQGHYVFRGGVHTFQKVSESEKLLFAANATLDNPTFWVEDGTTLNWKGRNPCGWNAAASNAGIVRVGSGAKVVALDADAKAGTWYWSQQFYLEDGATLEIGTTGDKFRTVGLDATNDVSKAQFVVPESATAEITGGDSNSLTLPANNSGAMVFNVEADATLTVSANLKTLANGKPFVKYGAGTLHVTGDITEFSAAIQVKEGTLEVADGSKLAANATVTVDEGATLKLPFGEDYTFTKSLAGTGTVVKAGAGTLALTPGQFGDNFVAIEEGALKFTLTHEQAASGVVLCKAEDDISGNVTVVNAAGEELEGAFTFADNTLSFKANCVDLYLVIDESSPASWSDLIKGKSWIDSPESTITITNETTVTFWFDVAITAKSLKIVSASSDVQLGISYEDFANLTIGSYDFTEAVSEVGGVAINCEDAPANTETRIITGATIAGFENVVPMDDDVPEGTGLYADASHIWLCKKANTTFANPVTGEEKTIAQSFFGTTDATWDNLANWRKAQDGLWVPATKIPGMQDGGYGPLVLDGDMTSETDVTATRLEGWTPQYALYNGMNVTVETLNKMQTDNQGFIWVDGTSSITFNTSGGNNHGTLSYAVANADGVTFTQKWSAGDNTITYNFAGDGSVNYAGGVSAGTHNLTNGTLKVEGDGFTGGNLNVVGDAALVTPALSAKVNIAADTTLSLTSTAEGDLTIAGNWTNNGTLDVVAGTVVFKPGVTPGTYTENGGKVIIGQTVTINDCGKIAVTGETADDVRLFDIGGNPVTVTKVEGGYAYYDWDVTDKNCWWDYEFNGNLTSTGTDTTTMSEEGTTPYYNEDETALRVGYGTPYRGASYPEEFTAVLYGKMVNNATHIEIGFGSTYVGTAKGVVIACGDPSQNEVKLLVTSGYGVVETIPMTVTDPYDTDHLYAFTCQTVGEGEDAKTKVSVYVDGKFLQAYTFGSKVTLGTGFQVGSIHGGSLAGYTKATTANTHADLDFLRVYQTVLSAEAMKMYADKYPYTSKGGASVRTFDGAGDWTVTEGTPWTVTPFEQESFPTNSALAGSQVTISASADAVVTMNLAEATTYESLTVNAGSAITIKAGEDAVEPTVTGLTDVRADVTVDYDAIKFGTIEVASGKTLTFDFDGFPFEDYYQDATIVFTGATSGEGTITAANLPTEGVRTATFVKNPSTDQYELKITVTAPFVYTIASGEETGTWTWNGEEVTEAIVDANPSTPIWKEGDGTLAKAISRTFVVKAGTLKATAEKVTGSVTVNPGATFDANGQKDTTYTVVLAGGSLVNTGAAIPVGKKQYASIAQTAASTVGGSNELVFVSDGYNPNTLDLGGFTLTKADANTFGLCNTTVKNGTIDVKGGTLQIVRNTTTFASDASLALGPGTTLELASTPGAAVLNIAAITADGATISNAGTISPFTLTGTATLAGDGTWSTNTLASGAVVNVGTKHDFIFAGAGTVNVTLTDAEYEAGQATLFTPGEGATTVVGTVMYNDDDITGKCTISGNQVTAIDKGPALESISIPETASVAVGATNQLALTLTPSDAAVISTMWMSEDEEICTVDQEGRVVGIAAGEVTVVVSVTDVYKNNKMAYCTVTVTATPSVPSWIDPNDWENVQRYNDWALAKGVTDPNDAIQEAFLFNVANNETEVELAKERFVIHSITVDSDGTVTIEPPNEADVGVEFFNGEVNVRGSATVDGDYTLPQEDPDARFFKAFLEMY